MSKCAVHCVQQHGQTVWDDGVRESTTRCCQACAEERFAGQCGAIGITALGATATGCETITSVADSLAKTRRQDAVWWSRP
mmetsp:Transcript_31988/g.106098  ORF Transcript_31988/g.106098 Transcript_31988/m.106098 type:complete len:81 (-) Transcript_31988:145-387(-)